MIEEKKNTKEKVIDLQKKLDNTLDIEKKPRLLQAFTFFLIGAGILFYFQEKIPPDFMPCFVIPLQLPFLYCTIKAYVDFKRKKQVV